MGRSGNEAMRECVDFKGTKHDRKYMYALKTEVHLEAPNSVYTVLCNNVNNVYM